MRNHRKSLVVLLTLVGLGFVSKFIASRVVAES